MATSTGEAAETVLQRASTAMWNNETAAAERLLRPRCSMDPRFALALSEVHWANSILAGNEVMLARTLERLNAATDMAQHALDHAKAARPPQRRTVRDMQVILADANFLAATTMVTLGQKLPAAWRTRKAWKLYLAALQTEHSESVDASLSRLFREAASGSGGSGAHGNSSNSSSNSNSNNRGGGTGTGPSDEQARAMFGVGACLVAVSWLPRGTTTMLLAQLAGFKVDRRDEGLAMLTRVAASRTSVRAPLASAVLLIDLLLMPHGVRHAPARRALAEELVHTTLQRWPHSSTFHWMAAAEAKKAGKTDEALRHIDEATHECLASGMFDAVPVALTVEKATLLVLALMCDAAALLCRQCLDAMQRAAHPQVAMIHGTQVIGVHEGDIPSGASSSHKQHQQHQQQQQQQQEAAAARGEKPSKRNLYEVRCELTLVQALALMGEHDAAVREIESMVARHVRARDKYLHDRDKGLIGLLQAALARATRTLLTPYELLLLMRDTAHLSADNARAFAARLAAALRAQPARATDAELLLHGLAHGALLKTAAWGRQSGRQSAAAVAAERAEARRELEHVAAACARPAAAAALPYCAAAVAYYELADIAAVEGDAARARALLATAARALSLPCLGGNAQYLNSEIISPRVKRALDEFSS